MVRKVCLFAVLCVLSLPLSAASALTLKEAVEHTINTNPGVGAAREARRASGYELRQAQGRLLPSVSLSGDVGYQKVDRPNGLAATRNDRWRERREAIVTVRQILFDGWNRANDIYKNAARLDASALRLYETSETRGLSAVEAFIDVVRHRKLLVIARENAARHRRILSLVNSRQRGGKAPMSEVVQARERLIAARAVIAEIQQALSDANAKFKRVVGLSTRNLGGVGYPRRLPRSKRDAVKIGTDNNPTIRAAQADADAAKHERDQAVSSYMPEVALEGRGSFGNNIGGTPGRNNDLTGKVTLTWNIFDGFIRTNRYKALSARHREALHRLDDRSREIVEGIEKAWAAYAIGTQRVRLFRSQVNASRKVVRAYKDEYELSKRSLLDLLDSENSLFSSQFQLISIQAVSFFSAYQVMASMGQLLASFNIQAPAETIADHRLQSQKTLGIFNINIEPLRK